MVSGNEVSGSLATIGTVAELILKIEIECESKTGGRSMSEPRLYYIECRDPAISLPSHRLDVALSDAVVVRNEPPVLDRPRGGEEVGIARILHRRDDHQHRVVARAVADGRPGEWPHDSLLGLVAIERSHVDARRRHRLKVIGPAHARSGPGVEAAHTHAGGGVGTAVPDLHVCVIGHAEAGPLMRREIVRREAVPDRGRIRVVSLVVILPTPPVVDVDVDL